MSDTKGLWVVGQAVSLALGVAMGLEFSSVGIGLCTTYGLAVLVDIRKEVIV